MITNNIEDISLLPMYIEAMIVGKKADELYADIELNYASLIDAPNGEALEPDAFRLHEGENKGIHLHWILPEQYTHGEQKEEHGEIIYPLLPNRWFVTRVAILYEKGQPTCLKKTWLIESDCIMEDPEKPDTMSMIHHADLKQPYRYLGYVAEYSGSITSNQEHLENFTAVTTGLPYFTAYYPQCRNVFGFYDSVSDIRLKSPEDYVDITYIVSGWVEMTSSTSKEIIHGAINSLIWKGKNANYDSGIPFHKNRINIAVGRTSNEAMAALVSKYANKQELEDMMHSLLLGELQEWSELDGQRDVMQKIHKDGFESIQAKPQLQLKQKQSQLTKAQYKILKEVEELYCHEQDEEEQIAIIKQSIYEIWKKSQSISKAECITEKEALEQIERLEKEFVLASNRHSEISNDIEQKKNKLSNMLLNDEEILEQDGQRYWKPTDIVLLLEGAKQDNIYKKIQKFQEMEYGEAGDNEKHDQPIHRKGTEIISSVTAKIFNIFKDSDITFTEKEIQNWFPSNKIELPAIFDNLIQEGILLSRSCVRYMMIQRMRQQSLEMKESNIVDAVVLYFQRMVIKPPERLPNPMVNLQWVASWNPLFIEWELTFYPDPQLTNEQFELNNWERDGLDFQYKGAPFSYQNAFVYSGRSILTPHITEVMEERFKEFENDKYPDIYTKLKETKVLSQCLGGFNEALLLRDRNQVVLPWQRKNQMLDTKVMQLIDDEPVYNKCKKNHPVFNIRCGKCKLDNVHLIDTLGRCYNYDIGDIITPQHLRLNGMSENAEFILPPRFLYPTRLYTSWDQVPISKQSDKVTYVYGWLWANITESCLHIYDDTGIFKGSLQLIYDTDDRSRYHISFQNPPGEYQELEEILAGCNECLRQFVLDFMDICKKEPMALSDVLKIISESMWNIHTGDMQKNSDIFAYLGHPLALVGLQMALERKQESQVQTDKLISRIDRTIIETKIGESEKQKDGVIGFFLHDEKKTYKKLHVCTNKAVTSTYMDNVTTIPMSFVTQQHPISITLLMSAYGKISFTTGVLPVKEIALPQDLVETALQNIYMTLFYGPFLRPQQELQLYLPKGMEKEWSYLEYERPKEKVEYTDIQQPWLEAVQNIGKITIKEGWLKLNAKKHSDSNKG